MIMASSYSRSADLAPLRPCGVPPACGLGSPPTTLKTRRFGLKTLWQCVTKILLSRCYLFISSAFVLAIESYRFWRFQRIMTWKGSYQPPIQTNWTLLTDTKFHLVLTFDDRTFRTRSVWQSCSARQGEQLCHTDFVLKVRSSKVKTRWNLVSVKRGHFVLIGGWYHRLS